MGDAPAHKPAGISSTLFSSFSAKKAPFSSKATSGDTKPQAPAPAGTSKVSFGNTFGNKSAGGGASVFIKSTKSPAPAAAAAAAKGDKIETPVAETASQPKSTALSKLATQSEKAAEPGPVATITKPSFASKPQQSTTEKAVVAADATKKPFSAASAASKNPPTSDVLTSSKRAPVSSATYREVAAKLNKWNQELKKKETEFRKRAEDVRKRDQKICENDAKIGVLEKRVQAIRERQRRIGNEVSTMKSRQDEISDMLRELRVQVQRDPRGMARNDAREQTFAMAEEIRHRLQDTHRELSSVVEQLRSTTDTDENSGSNAMSHVKQILGAHVDTLVWVHQRTDTLEQRLDTLERGKQMHSSIGGY